ncbi:hypothetical protein D3C73_1462000 [compost metagenome]
MLGGDISALRFSSLSPFSKASKTASRYLAYREPCRLYALTMALPASASDTMVLEYPNRSCNPSVRLVMGLLRKKVTAIPTGSSARLNRISFQLVASNTTIAAANTTGI